MKKKLVSSEELFLGIIALLILGFTLGNIIGQTIWNTYLK
jgi:hypothetical protein